MDAAEKLANWILVRARESDVGGVTHLKLQKLLFYVYGAALAFDHDREVGPVSFEAWKHGPVVREVWRKYHAYGRDPIPAATNASPYCDATERDLLDALTVYGALDAWSLRQESHLEQPWIDAFEASETSIPADELRAYFKTKYLGEVRFPRQYLVASNLSIDGIPEHAYATLHDLAAAVTSTRDEARASGHESGWPAAAL
jgi:uncharacterized phage-associated protein